MDLHWRAPSKVREAPESRQYKSNFLKMLVVLRLYMFDGRFVNVYMKKGRSLVVIIFVLIYILAVNSVMRVFE